MLTEIELLSLSADELTAQIEEHNRRYWEDNAPTIPDSLYDMLVERLRALQPTAPVLQALEPAPAADAVRIEHRVPMLSLEKCYSEEELLRWFGRFKGSAVVTPKIDGVAMSLRYDENGLLEVAATRGDGREGEIITENAKRILGVPAQIAVGPLEVRGEAYMPLSTFKSRWAEIFANPRNLAAGALKQKNPERTREYGIQFFAYEALGLDDIPTETARFDQITALGFTHVPYQIADAETAQATFDAISAQRDSFDYETDGIVYRVNDSLQHEAMGRTAHHPRFAIAYKFQGESGISTLRAVEWSVSRTGKINPVAIVDAVSLSGVTVRRVSLHNLGIMETLGGGALPFLGSTVMVTRRGGVIPHLEAVVDAGDEPVNVPAQCPSCGADTRREDDFLVADHAVDCVTSAIKRLEHFSAVADIRGLGPKVLEALFEDEHVREPADIYLLDARTVSMLERMGEKSAQNLIQAIGERRSLRVATFLAALGIRDLGTQVALSLEAEFPTWEELYTAEVPRLTAIDGVGEIVAGRIREGFALLEGVIARLLMHVTLVWPVAAAPIEGPLSGASVVFTGAMERMARKDAQVLVRANGGTTPTTVTADLRYLVLGDGDHAKYLAGERSSKSKRAEALQAKGAALEIISESQFLALVGVGESA